MTYLALNSLLAAPFIALVPAVALKVFGNEDTGTSVLITAQGIGAVLMALMLGGLGARYGHRISPRPRQGPAPRGHRPPPSGSN